MSIKRTVYLSTLTLLLTALSVLPALGAADMPAGDSKEISDLLSQAKTQANQLKTDASDMESFTLSNLSWQTHAAKIMAIKEHVSSGKNSQQAQPGKEYGFNLAEDRD